MSDDVAQDDRPPDKSALHAAEADVEPSRYRAAPRSAQEFWLRRPKPSALRSSSTARPEPRTVPGRADPGIGMTTGAAASIHASVTCWGLTPCASAISWNAANLEPKSAARELPPRGDQGRNAIPSAWQRRSSGSELR